MIIVLSALALLSAGFGGDVPSPVVQRTLFA
jgi:hypothetical protein